VKAKEGGGGGGVGGDLHLLNKFTGWQIWSCWSKTFN